MATTIQRLTIYALISSLERDLREFLALHVAPLVEQGQLLPTAVRDKAIERPILEQLSLTTGESGHFAVRMSDDVVVMARTPGPSKFQLTDRVGIVRPAYCTALGKVILAALRPEQFDRYLSRVELKPLTPKTVIDRQRFVQEIEDVRSSGIGFDDGEFDEEVRCAAMPVRDFSGQVVGAIGISGPVWRLSFQALQSRAKALEAAASELSAALGAPEQAR